MDYGELVSRGWRITWNNKFLWVLGFLAALGSASGNFNSGNNISQRMNSGGISPDLIAVIGAVGAVFACIIFIVAIVFTLVSLVARGGLIDAVARIDDGETVTLGEAFAAGTAKIWSLLGMGVLLYLPYFVLIMVGVSMVIFGVIASAGGVALFDSVESIRTDAFLGAMGIFFVCFFALMCVLIPVGVFLQFIHAFAFRGIMLQGLGAVDGIRHGWQILRENAGEILMLAILFFFIGLVYSFATMIVLMPLALVLFVPLFTSTMRGGDVGMFEMLVLVGGGICVGIFGALLNSIITTWRSATFTLAYREFTNKKLGDVVVDTAV
ncbi:MAG: hypothetical protein Kow0080_33830 [Candidatus Promineifilaceae bacterium]